MAQQGTYRRADGRTGEVLLCALELSPVNRAVPPLTLGLVAVGNRGCDFVAAAE